MPLDTALANRLEPDAEASVRGPRGAWCVVQTNPQAERWATTSLSRAGYEAYLPTMVIRRRDPVVRTLTRLVPVPLFAGYTFVVAGTHWAPIRYCEGVFRLLLADGQPGRVRRGFVEDLQRTASARECLAEPGLWRAGASCRIASGPFAGHSAVIAAVAGHSARVGVIVFGAMREVTVSLDALEPR